MIPWQDELSNWLILHRWKQIKSSVFLIFIWWKCLRRIVLVSIFFSDMAPSVYFLHLQTAGRVLHFWLVRKHFYNGCLSETCVLILLRIEHFKWIFEKNRTDNCYKNTCRPVKMSVLPAGMTLQGIIVRSLNSYNCCLQTSLILYRTKKEKNWNGNKSACDNKRILTNVSSANQKNKRHKILWIFILFWSVWHLILLFLAKGS